MLDVVLKLLVQGIALGLSDDDKFGSGKGAWQGGKNWREGVILDELQVDLFESKPPQHVPAPAWLLARVLTHGSHVDSLNLARIGLRQG